MQIPKRFKLYGHTIEIEYTDEVIHGDTEVDGVAMHSDNKIVLVDRLKKESPTYHEKVFWHEVVHFILDSGKIRIDGNEEQTVDYIAQCLNQIINSIEFE